MSQYDVMDSTLSAAGKGRRATIRRGVRLGKLFDIEIEIDSSWFFVFALVTWNLWTGFSQWHPDWSVALDATTALAASLLFFASVLAHELAHSLVARRRGLPVHSITLFFFGGVSNLQREPESPATEFVMAIVGPLTSLFLGFLFLALGSTAAGGVQPALDDPVNALAHLSPLSTLLLWLGQVNILVGLFNMVPAFPLDGGRVFRSLVWGATKDLPRATKWAAKLSHLIAWSFMIAGVAMMFGARVPFFGSGFIGGIWIAMIGWFLRGAAVSSSRQLVVSDPLDGVGISRVMPRRDSWPR